MFARIVWCVLGMIPGVYVPSARDGCGVSLQNCASRRPLHCASWSVYVPSVRDSCGVVNVLMLHPLSLHICASRRPLHCASWSVYMPSVRDGCGVVNGLRLHPLSLQNCASRRPLHCASWSGCVNAMCTGWRLKQVWFSPLPWKWVVYRVRSITSVW